MKLTLINDLPLLSGDREHTRLDLLVSRWLDARSQLLPAQVTYVGHKQFEHLWAASWPTGVATCLLIGTRPNLLAACGMTDGGAVKHVSIHPKRIHNSRGHTASVRTAGRRIMARQLSAGEHLCVLDDVMMSGSTVMSVLDTLAQLPLGSVQVRCVAATEHALRRVRRSHPGIDVCSQVVIDYEPIREGTVIFVWDLLFGTLRGRPFLTQTELLRPYFGDDLRPLYGLRAAVVDHGVSDQLRRGASSTARRRHAR